MKDVIRKTLFREDRKQEEKSKNNSELYYSLEKKVLMNVLCVDERVLTNEL